MTEKVKMTFYIDKELKKKVQIKAIEEEKSVTEILNSLLESYVEKQ